MRKFDEQLTEARVVQVSLNNDYLSSRYDSLIVDSKPWGRGQDGECRALLVPFA
jgi:hypothetical protein